MNSRVDIDALAEGAHALCDPQFDEESFEERCQREGENLAEQALYRLKRKFIDEITQEMAPIYFNDIATNYIKDHKDELLDAVEEELLSWTK